MESQTTEQMPRKKSLYNKERYEQNKEEILKYRRERYRTIHKKAIELFLYIIFIHLMYQLPNNFIELLWSKRMKQMTLKHGAKVIK